MNYLSTLSRNYTFLTKTKWAYVMVALAFLVANIVQLILVTPTKAASVTSEVSFSVAGTLKGCGTMQGGATDQQYLYFLCENGQITIHKYTPDGVEVAKSKPFSRSELGHANDMTYNARRGLLVVSMWDTNGGGPNKDKVKLIDPNTFEVKGTMQTSDNGSVSNICYNESLDQYLSGGRIYDANLKFQKRIYTTSQVDSDLGVRGMDDILNQGIECNASRIYIMRVVSIVNSNADYNLIGIYDWNGTFIGSNKVPLNDEGENLMAMGNTMYMGVNEGVMSSGGNSQNDYFVRIDGLVSGSNACSAPQSALSPTVPNISESPVFDTSTNAYRSYNNIPFTGGSSSCCLASSSDLIGATNPERAFNFLISTPIKSNNGKPLNQAQAAGAVGNLMVESTPEIKPDIQNSIGAYGIAQWLGGRKKELSKFAASKGTEVSDFRTQLEFIIYELENSESAIIKDKDFQGVSQDEAGARTAAVRWDTRYERSGGAGLAARQEHAAAVFNDFSDVGSSPGDDMTLETTTGPPPTSAAGCGSGASGDYVFPLQATKEEVRKWGNNPGTTEWKSGRYHEDKFAGYFAVDLLAPEGTPVVAFHGGTVIHIREGDSYGALSIQIKDDEGYTYYYQHLSLSRGSKVQLDQKVEAGTLIAYVGNLRESWNSVPHLHIDKSKNPGKGLRGTCTASKGNCPIASEHRFVKIVQELHDSFEELSDTGASSL